jgi:hypothetical protein
MKWLLKLFRLSSHLSEQKTFSELLSLRVFHLTWLLLLYTNTWLSIYCFHCIHGIVTLKPKVIRCVLGPGRKRLFEGNGRDTCWIVSDFVRALNEATEVKMAWVSGCPVGAAQWGPPSGSALSLPLACAWPCRVDIKVTVEQISQF